MKRILLIFTVTLLSVMGINAQNIGIKAGYNYSNFKGEDTKNFELKGYSGFYVGALVELPLFKTFSIQPELIYSRQGKFEIKDVTSSSPMDYITIPVLAKISLTKMISIQGGSQFGFLVNSPEFESAQDVTSGKKKISKDVFGTFDFGLGIGASVNLPAGIFFEARYNRGFTNVFNNNNKKLQALPFDSDFKNSVLSVGIGYRL